MNSARAALGAAKLKRSATWLTPDERIDLQYSQARELLNAGKTDEALALFQALEHEIQQNPPMNWPNARNELLTREAVAYLRLGEQQNCCDLNNAASCLLPISGTGVHTRQTGSRKAIERLIRVLRATPHDIGARWLLNIAYMTLGEYPQNVPAQWRIPLQNFGGEYPMQQFYNAAPQMGLDQLGWAGSVSMEDFDGDGLLDLIVSSMRPGVPLCFYHNNGNGAFTERAKEAGLLGETGGLNILTTDYNNDGLPDLVVLRGGWLTKSEHYPLSLLRNDGHGHFTDVTAQAGLLTYGHTQAAVAFDYNGDGFLDLFVGYEAVPDDPGAMPCKLFRNNGNGTFTDVTAQSGLGLQRFVKAVISADFTHNGRPGLYLSCCNQRNILLRNDGPAGSDRSPNAPWKFTDVTSQAGVDKQKGSFSCCFFDYDNDGWPDIFAVGYMLQNDVGDIAKDYLKLPTEAEKAVLYHNNHDGTFTDVTQKVHLDRAVLGMGINFGDLDNDGWLDVYCGTGAPDLALLIPNRMFRNHNGHYFEEVTTTGNFGHLQKGHGIAFGDLNNTGQQDIFAVMGGMYEGDTAHDVLFVNPGNRNHWVTLTLEGVKSNRIALGAEICVTVDTPAGRRNVFRTVSTGGSFGNNPLRQEIGLGDATAIRQVSIRWPASGLVQVVDNIRRDGFYKVREGAPEAELMRLPTFQLPHAPADTVGKKAAR